jgi:uncharacterized lipoprotein YddW (UPF0748 family)
MNAVVLQVRPAADALYPSRLEPWSEYLSGDMGIPPEPYYDPLAFAIEEAHRRGLELHAWFNPFRARHATKLSPPAPDHVSLSLPGAVVQYGDQLWLDPGDPDARAHSLAVILDVLVRYDVDGIHMDDYFYPYPIQDTAGREVAFPDTASRARAIFNRASTSIEDWRRKNIDRFIERLYSEVKRLKPWVKVGISPFGIWRPGYPAGVRGFDAYGKLYADSRLWLQEGWVDYLTPQLYWSIDSEGQSYPALYGWWRAQNVQDRHIWPGNSIYRIESSGWPVGEILEQVEIPRRSDPNPGHILFSMRVLESNAGGISERLLAQVYQTPALVPAMPWLRIPAPNQPIVDFQNFAGAPLITMRPFRGDDVAKWIVRFRDQYAWTLRVVPGWQQNCYLPEGEWPVEVIVSAVNRAGVEGPTAVVRIGLARAE